MLTKMHITFGRAEIASINRKSVPSVKRLALSLLLFHLQFEFMQKVKKKRDKVSKYLRSWTNLESSAKLDTKKLRYLVLHNF